MSANQADARQGEDKPMALTVEQMKRNTQNFLLTEKEKDSRKLQQIALHLEALGMTSEANKIMDVADRLLEL